MALTRKALLEKKKRLRTDLCNLDHGLHDTVADHAVRIRSALSNTINKYGEDSAVEFLPICTLLLEEFNSMITENANLAAVVTSLRKDCHDNLKALNLEKLRRQDDQEMSIDLDKDSEQRICALKAEINRLQITLEKAHQDITTKTETVIHLNDNINALNIDLDCLKRKNEKLSEDVILLQHRLDDHAPSSIPAHILKRHTPDISTVNKFAPLSIADELLECTEGVECDGEPENVASKRRRRRRKRSKKQFTNIALTVYSDSHGRNMSRLLGNEVGQKSCLVKPGIVKPGAPLKEVIKGVKADSGSFKSNDFIVVIGGTNDIGSDRESGLVDVYADLLASVPNTKCLISTIPPRYDLSPYSKQNKIIRHLNSKIKELRNIFKNVKILDLGAKSFQMFSKRGIHFHHRGKILICREIKQIVGSWATQEPLLSPGAATAATKRTAHIVSSPSIPTTSLGHLHAPISHSPRSSESDYCSPNLTSSKRIQQITESPILSKSVCDFYDNGFLGHLGIV